MTSPPGAGRGAGGSSAPPATPARIAPELDGFARVGRWLAAAESGSKDAEAVGMRGALRLYFADVLGLSPLAAAELSVIDGRLVVSAKLLRGIAYERGFRVVPAELSDEACTAVVYDRETGAEIGRTTFAYAEAQAAGLVKERGAWVKWRRRMLWARASKFAIDDYAPQVSVGLLTAEEAEDDAPAPDGSDSPVEVERVEVEGAEEAEAVAWEEIAADDAADDARRRHFGALRRLEESGAPLPDGFDTWESVSKDLLRVLFPNVRSRGDLDEAGWDRLTAEVEAQAVPFG